MRGLGGVGGVGGVGGFRGLGGLGGFQEKANCPLDPNLTHPLTMPLAAGNKTCKKSVRYLLIPIILH